jgi:hypothetical protein
LPWPPSPSELTCHRSRGCIKAGAQILQKSAHEFDSEPHSRHRIAAKRSFLPRGCNLHYARVDRQANKNTRPRPTVRAVNFTLEPVYSSSRNASPGHPPNGGP